MKDGGPAFPYEFEELVRYDKMPGAREGDPQIRTRVFCGNGGMSLRDYFAAAALTGILLRTGTHPKKAAVMALRHADALLAARR